jgi:polyvinyl alcohol dehydrogenase (cytochrome)
MDIVERYLKSVRRYLPATDRDDIVAELYANLSAEIDDREIALGRKLDVPECEALLSAHGHPVAVALRYRSVGQTFAFGKQIVGPVLFPFYVRVLAANVLVACLIAIFAAFYGVPSWIGVANILSHVLLQFAIVTVVFAVLERYLDRGDPDWRLGVGSRAGTARAVGTKPVSRLESISGLIWFVGSNVWLIDLFRTQNLFRAEPESTLVLTPVWHQILLPYIAIVVLEIVRNVVNLVRPDMLRFRALMIASASFASFVATLLLLHGGSLVVPANAIDPGQLAIARAVDRGIFVSLIVMAVGIPIAMAWQLRIFFRLRGAVVSLAIASVLAGFACTGLSREPARAEAVDSGVPVRAGHCSADVMPLAVRPDSPQWNGWGADLSQSRFQPASVAGIDAADVPRLKLKWAFGFPGVGTAYGQPTVIGGELFVGSENHRVYALNARSGCIIWDFDAGFPVRAAITVGQIDDRWAAFVGDQHANVFALDAVTGRPIWKTRVDDHAAAIITGAPTLARGRLYVPVSSTEEAMAADRSYACCTFRGSVVALDIRDGKTIWKTYTVPADARGVSTAPRASAQFGPSGAAVWSSPAIDLKRRAVYVATGNNYSDSATDMSDALLAFDMDSGRVEWKRQMTPGDAENVACGLPPPFNANCPHANGPDLDFGSSPVLQTLDDGHRVLIAAQKSGVVYALDPDRPGAQLWQTRVGLGSKLGGVQWGVAAEAGVVYAAVSDVGFNPVAAGTAGAQPSAFGVSFELDPQAGGGLVALDERTGAIRWKTPHPGCNARPGCSPAQSAAVTAMPGIVFSGGLDGHLRAYGTATGAIVWDVDTIRSYDTVDGVRAAGGSLDGPGATIAGGMLYVNSGYRFLGTAPGNVLLAYSVDAQ